MVPSMPRLRTPAALGVRLADGAVHERRRVAQGGREQVDEEGHPGCASARDVAGRPTPDAGRSRSPRPMAPQGQQRDRGQEQDALDDGAQLRGDAERTRRRAGADGEVAQEERGDRTPGIVRVPSVATTIPV